MTIAVKQAGITVVKAGEKLAQQAAAPKLSKVRTIPRAAMTYNPIVDPSGITVVKAGDAKNIPPPQRIRAVTKDEISYTLPARESNKHSLEPWKGWFSNMLKDVLPPKYYETYRRVTNFMPDDIYDLSQAPKPAQQIPISKTDPSITAMYRYPSPGSQDSVRLPSFEAHEDPYDSGYFKRDTRRRYLFSELSDKNVEEAKLKLMNQNDPDVQEELAKLASGPVSSQGNNGKFATGPSNFDPTGLRTTMSVSWKALEASLDKHMPDHLPRATWEGKEAEIVKFFEERDLPVPVGDYFEELKVPRSRRMATW